MYDEDDLLPISALQHLAFCERQWALIHLEGAWEENVLTVQGSQLHDRVHEAETEVRGDLRVARGLRVRSLRLGLIGMADVVEFHRLSKAEEESCHGATRPMSIQLAGASGLWRPVIVEYKRGRPKLEPFDEQQLCAQALCFEEMLGVTMPLSYIFYGTPRRRHEVVLDDALRRRTEALVEHLHQLTLREATPPPEYTAKCKSCSLVDLCLPETSARRVSVQSYLARAIQAKEDSS